MAARGMIPMQEQKQPQFEGWYFKHQCAGETVALIPGRAACGSFVQVVANDRSWNFAVPSLFVGSDIQAGSCLFSRAGVTVDLPGIHGQIQYGPLTPLRSDIMGPFRHLPMECRHGVISMQHTLTGTLDLEGRTVDFTGGLGYIEKDCGASFPSRYLWLQANDFSEPCSIMLAVARIPLGGAALNGCICAIAYGGQEYRLATYRGVRVLAATPQHIRLAQGSLLLEVDLTHADDGVPLRAPEQGRMTAAIRESSTVNAHFRFFRRGQLVFDLTSLAASFEYRDES